LNEENLKNFLIEQKRIMEHKIYHNIRKIKLPYFIRIFLGWFLILTWIISIILPLPLSVPTGIVLIIVGITFVIEAKDIKNVRKIRKWIFYLSKNLKDSKIRKHKIKDIKKHTKYILKNKKWKNR